MRLAGALVAASLCGSPLAAQSIRGQVVDALTAAPLASALVEVRADSGDVIFRRTTDPQGRFHVVLPRPGRYHVSFAAIGFVRLRSSSVDVGAETWELPVTRLQATTVELAELVSIAGTGGCRLAPEASAQLARVLDAGSVALRVMHATLSSGGGRMGATVIDRTVMYSRRDSLIEDDTLHVEHLSWPVHTAPAIALETRGFAHEISGLGHTEWEFHGPDAEVLFSPWFLESHCFDAAMSRNNDSLIVSFRPVGRAGPRVDIAGRLVFDPRTLILQRLTFEHENLPDGMPRGSVGGSVDFEATGDGTWLPVRWTMRAPIGSRRSAAMASDGRGSVRTITFGSVVIGSRQVHGRVLREDD